MTDKKTIEWKCEICNTIFDTKKELVDDTIGHLEDASQELDEAIQQAEWLSIKNLEQYQ